MQNLIEKAKAAFKPQPQPQPQPAAKPSGPNPVSEPVATPPVEPVTAAEPKPEANLVAAPKSAKELAEETARQVGILQGDEFANIKLCKAQTPRNSHMLYIEGVPRWNVRAICWVKDAESWKPVCPPHDTLRVKYTGIATTEGVLQFESSDISKRNRLRRAQ
jgi:hypothetical protein